MEKERQGRITIGDEEVGRGRGAGKKGWGNGMGNQGYQLDLKRYLVPLSRF